MDFYAAEYEDYWDRSDRWGGESFTNPEQVLVPLLQGCGRGSVLDVGCGMGRLVSLLVDAGVDAHGVDVAPRVVRHAHARHRGRFHLGSALALPFGDGTFDTVLSTDTLEHVAVADLPQAVDELRRVARQAAFVTVSTAPDHEPRQHQTFRPRGWWEQFFFDRGFRRHPRLLRAIPYTGLDDEPRRITLVFQKDPAAGDDPESATSTDWGRVSGGEADAHLSFYTLASAFARPGDLVVDLVAGAGFGPAVLDHAGEDLAVLALSSTEDVAYARRHYAPTSPRVHFTDDPHDLRQRVRQRGGADVLVLHGVPGVSDASRLRELAASLRPGGRVVCHVPATPTSTRTFDGARLSLDTEPEEVLEALLPDAGDLFLGHCFAHDHVERRRLAEVKLPRGRRVPTPDGWILVFEKAGVPEHARRRSLPRRDTVVVLAHHRSGDHLRDFVSRCPFPVDVVHRFGVDWTPPVTTGLVVSLEAYDEPGVSALRSAVERGVPTLVLADGIIEYQNTWEHPQNVPGAIMQPVLGHKVACLGAAQARILHAWGNYGRCEVVGAPRFDRYLRVPPRATARHRPCRVLVATAKTPYFTAEQRTSVRSALADLRDFFCVDRALPSPRFEVRWRIGADLATELGLAEVNEAAHQVDVLESLSRADALVTTPSTLMLEGMLLGLPVAALDYRNTPHYFQAAWSITSPSHVSPVLEALAEPEPARLLFQAHALHDMCACGSPAWPRLVHLMGEMIAAGERARAGGTPLLLPLQIVPADAASTALPENEFQLERLYPAHWLFERRQRAAMHYEIAHLRRLIGSKESDLNRFDGALRAFDAELRARQEQLSAFERSLLACRADLDARASALGARERAFAQRWHATRDEAWTVGASLAYLVRTLAPQRPVYCWGAGELGRRLLDLLGDAARAVVGFIDSDPRKQGGTCFGSWPIVGPDILAACPSAERPFVLVTSMLDTQIVGALSALGFSPGRDFLTVPALIDHAPAEEDWPIHAGVLG